MSSSKSHSHNSTDYGIHHLENGLAIATANMPHMSSVAVGIWVGVGGRYESADLNGVSHFIEHMLFKGTQRRNARELSEAIEGIGGYLNAFTSEDHTCFYARAPANRGSELIDVLGDMFLNSRFNPVEIDKERDVILEEVSMGNDQPAQYVHELLNAVIWPGQPLGRPLTGTLRSLRNLDREKLVSFFNTNYCAASTILAVAGNVDESKTLLQIRSVLGKCRKGTKPSYAPAFARQTVPAIKWKKRAVEQTQFALGVRACSRKDPRRHALRLLNVLVGENTSSRLFQIVREEHGLAYNISSAVSAWDDVGDFVISAGVDEGKLPKALKLITQELVRFTKVAPTRTQLDRASDYLIGQMDLSLESTENHMMALGEQWLAYGKLSKPDETKQLLQRVTPSHVRQVARDLFRPEQFNLAVVSPNPELKKIGRLFDQY